MVLAKYFMQISSGVMLTFTANLSNSVSVNAYTVKNPSWKFRNIFMKARTLSSIFLNFSILSHWFLNIHPYRAYGSKLPHTFFTVYWRKNNTQAILANKKMLLSCTRGLMRKRKTRQNNVLRIAQDFSDYLLDFRIFADFSLHVKYITEYCNEN
jgi:hypothetical protein